MAYGEMSLRQAGDIDLLINRRDFTQARLLLESLGYEMTPRLTPAQLSSHLNNHCEIQFMRDEWLHGCRSALGPCAAQLCLRS
jgi:hypothetical protein